MTYAVVINKTDTGFSAHVPDLPGCIGTAATLPKIEALMAEAIRLHIEFNRELGEEIPPPTTFVYSVSIEEECATR